MTYDCEIEGCVTKTDKFLCELHEDQALDENNTIVVCEKCNKILKIKKRKDKKSEPRYEFVTDCMRCHSQTDQEIQ